MKKITRKIILLVSVLCLGLMIGCSKKSGEEKEYTNKPIDPPKELPIATIKVKDYGTIEAELYPHLAPNTVNNFISLANSGFYDNGFKNDIKHEKGILSMARSQQPDSAGSQFFIVTKDAKNLDKQYAAFGKVIKGMDVVDKINNVEVGSNDKPKKNVVIESIRVDTKGVEYKPAEKIK